MTKIIGHRGAAGLELENSRASFLAAIRHGVDLIELDVRLTADDKLVLSHDPITSRISKTNVIIRNETLEQLKQMTLRNGEPILTLDEALQIIGNVPVIIEVKDTGSADELLMAVGRHPNANIVIASKRHEEIRMIHKLLPDIPTYALSDFNPIEIVRDARRVHANGIGLNKWIMNPLTYYLARRHSLDIYVYTIDNAFMVKMFRKIYPHLHICTNHPDRFAL